MASLVAAGLIPTPTPCDGDSRSLCCAWPEAGANDSLLMDGIGMEPGGEVEEGGGEPTEGEKA